MNKPVNFEIAKLIKEKGFDVKTTGSYVDTTPFSENENDFVEYFFEQNHNEKEHRVSAPTIAEVVMWLYEKHEIWINVDCDCYGELWYAKLSVASENNWNNIDLRHEIVSATKKFPNEHNTSTEAYEAAIIYTLKNLI